MVKYKGISETLVGALILTAFLYFAFWLFTPPSVVYMFLGGMRGGERPLDIYHCNLKHTYNLPKDTLIFRLKDAGLSMQISSISTYTDVRGEIHNFFCGKIRTDVSFEIVYDEVQRKTTFSISNITAKEAKDEEEYQKLEVVYCECWKKQLLKIK